MYKKKGRRKKEEINKEKILKVKEEVRKKGEKRDNRTTLTAFCTMPPFVVQKKGRNRRKKRD